VQDHHRALAEVPRVPDLPAPPDRGPQQVEAAAQREDLLPHPPQSQAQAIRNREAGKQGIRLPAAGSRQKRKSDSQETAVAFFIFSFCLNCTSIIGDNSFLSEINPS
jgi:hypothetical protein